MFIGEPLFSFKLPNLNLKQRINDRICKIFGHKFNQTQLAIFEIRNNPENVRRHGFTSITCPRCKTLFDPGEPDGRYNNTL